MTTFISGFYPAIGGRMKTKKLLQTPENFPDGFEGLIDHVPACNIWAFRKADEEQTTN